MMETDHESIPPSEALIHEESEIDATGETEAKPDSPMEVRTESGKMEEGQLQGGDYRVKLDNVPRFVGSSQMKKFLKRYSMRSSLVWASWTNANFACF